MNPEETDLGNRHDILDKIVIFLEPWMDESESQHILNDETNLIMQIGLDSIGILQLISCIEETYNIKIHDHELDIDTFSMLKNFIDLVQSKLHETH